MRDICGEHGHPYDWRPLSLCSVHSDAALTPRSHNATRETESCGNFTARSSIRNSSVSTLAPLGGDATFLRSQTDRSGGRHHFYWREPPPSYCMAAWTECTMKLKSEETNTPYVLAYSTGIRNTEVGKVVPAGFLIWEWVRSTLTSVQYNDSTIYYFPVNLSLPFLLLVFLLVVLYCIRVYHTPYEY